MTSEDLDLVNRVVLRNPELLESADWNYNSAYCFHSLGINLHEALHRYDLALELGYDELAVRYRRAYLYRDLGNMESARADLERALELRPNDPATLLMLYRLPVKGVEEKITKIREMIDGCQYQDSAVQLSDLVTVLPKDRELNYLLALCLHIQNKDLELAMKHYDAALQCGFDEFWVKYNRGSLYAKLGNTEQAKADLMRAVELKPEHDGAMEMLKSSVINILQYLLNKNELKNAIAFTEQTEQQRPELTKQGDWNYLSALCLHNLGANLQEAIRRYDLALEQGFDEFWVKYNRGSLYAKLGNNEQAKQDLMRAVELKPEHDGARETSKLLAATQPRHGEPK